AKKFVKEAVVDGRADAELDVGVKLHHGGGEQVSCGVTEDEKGVGILVGEDFELEVLLKRAAEIDKVAAVVDRFAKTGELAVIRINLCNERCVRQARRDAFGDVGGRCPFGNVFDAAVGQSDVNRVH